MKPMRLRPHHILDILASYGAGEAFEPQASGSAVHVAAARILGDTGAPIRLVAGTDDICVPCRNLENGARCTRMMEYNGGPYPMQDYNDALDRRLLGYLGLAEGAEMTAGDFFGMVAGKVPGIEKLCAHPGEEEAKKRSDMSKGLARLAGRKP